MKNFSKKLIDSILIIVLIPILLIAVLWLLLMTPIDYIRYKRSPYYKDLRKKYTFAVCYNDTYVLYNLIKKSEIPEIVYHPKEENDPCGYFTLFDILLIYDLSTTIYYEKKKDGFYLIAPEEEASDGNENGDEDNEITLAEYTEHLLLDAQKDLPDIPLTRSLFLYDDESASKQEKACILREPLLLPYTTSQKLHLALFELVSREMELRGLS